ncbi:MAG: hypothetical protein JWR00_3301 [Rubritepida sp.]|nr:hypothetical protein [Rubritepida sp.]
MELESSSATRRRGRLKTHEGLHRTLTQITESEEDLARRREALSGKAAVSEQRPELKAIATSIDAARALGADVDARCASAQRKADLAASSLNQALTRLAPWPATLRACSYFPGLHRTR